MIIISILIINVLKVALNNLKDHITMVKVLIRKVELTLRVFFSVPISEVQLHTMQIKSDQIVVKLGF